MARETQANIDCFVFVGIIRNGEQRDKLKSIRIDKRRSHASKQTNGYANRYTIVDKMTGRYREMTNKQ